jgi:hypothetical protein
VDCSDPRNCRSASCDRRHLGRLQPHNGLINDDAHDACSIDFERGSTGNWVHESMETKESFVFGVGKTFEFLNI